MTLDQVVAVALAEDLGDRGDVTAQATVPESATLRAQFTARRSGTAAGVAAIAATYAQIDAAVAVDTKVTDGQLVSPGDVLAVVHGPARAVLAGERTALNLVSHLSGIATMTARYVEALHGSGCVVRDTRKTLPGLRALQKAAVVAGGGTNHRAGLHDALLVKDNHVAAAGSVASATTAALANHGGLPVQVEVDDIEQLRAALQAGARCVLLDNFALAALPAAVAVCRAVGEPVFVEVSGGVTLDTAAAIAATGVDAIAVGALTHSVAALDIGLDVV